MTNHEGEKPVTQSLFGGLISPGNNHDALKGLFEPADSGALNAIARKSPPPATAPRPEKHSDAIAKAYEDWYRRQGANLLKLPEHPITEDEQ